MILRLAFDKSRIQTSLLQFLTRCFLVNPLQLSLLVDDVAHKRLGKDSIRREQPRCRVQRTQVRLAAAAELGQYVEVLDEDGRQEKYAHRRHEASVRRRHIEIK